MQSIITVRNQSLIDLALQMYGNVDAVSELLRLNDLQGKMSVPGDYDANEIDLAFSVKEGVTIVYDENSPLVNKKALKALNGAVLATGIVVKLFLLDIAKSAKAAYSLRKLNTAYNGPCIRLRKGTGGGALEADFGFTGEGYLDTAAITTWLGGSTGYLAKWYDQSGNSLNFQQTAEALQPIFQLSGIKAKPTISFAGAHAMVIPATLSTFNFLHSFTSAWTISWVINQPNNYFRPILDNTTAQPTFPGFYVYPFTQPGHTAEVALGKSGAGGGEILSGANFFAGDTYNAITFNGADYVFRKNSVIKSTITPAWSINNSNAAADMTMGAFATTLSQKNTFTISELVIWPSNKTAIMTNIDTDVNQFYGNF